MAGSSPTPAPPLIPTHQAGLFHSQKNQDFVGVVPLPENGTVLPLTRGWGFSADLNKTYFLQDATIVHPRFALLIGASNRIS